MEHKKLTAFEKLQSIMCNYQEDYEVDKNNIWVKNFDEHDSKFDDLSRQINDEIREYVYSAQYLGFVQGMNYALDLMNISGRGENKEILKKFLRSIEYTDKDMDME